jgi:hypothetical protein
MNGRKMARPFMPVFSRTAFLPGPALYRKEAADNA